MVKMRVPRRVVEGRFCLIDLQVNPLIVGRDLEVGDFASPIGASAGQVAADCGPMAAIRAIALGRDWLEQRRFDRR